MRELNYTLVRYKIVRVCKDENGKITFESCFPTTTGHNFTYKIGKDVKDKTKECYGIFCFKKLKQARAFSIRSFCVSQFTILEVTPLTRSNRKDIKKLDYFKTNPIPEGTIRYNKISVIREVK